jgi:hypothetical protein
VKVDSLMYYNMSKFQFIILISQFMRAIFRAAHNFCEQVYIGKRALFSGSSYMDIGYIWVVCKSKNGRHKDMCLKEVGLHAWTLLTYAQ